MSENAKNENAKKKTEYAAEVRFVPAMDAWSFALGDDGPAGTTSVLLSEEVRLSADAATTSPVEIAVVVSSSGTVSDDALEAVELLVGSEAADFLEGREQDGVTHHVPVSLTGVASAATALGRAWMLQSFTMTRHPLRILDEVVALQALRAFPACAEQARNAAQSVWPAVVSLARSCQDPTMLTAIRPAEREALQARILVARELIAEHQPERAVTLAFAGVTRFLEDLVAHVDAAATVRRDTRGSTAPWFPTLDAAPPVRELVSRGDEPTEVTATPTGVPVMWLGRVDDFALRLGPAIRMLHDGVIRAEGVRPGELVVQVPVLVGVRTADLSEIVVRALTEDGRLIAEGRLGTVHASDGLPFAEARLPLPAVIDARPWVDLRIDLAKDGTLVPDADGLARLQRLRGLRAGQAAVAAATTGAYALSADLWRECANHLEGIDEANSRTAREHAASAEARAKRATASPAGPDTEDWLTLLLDGWGQWAHGEVVDNLATLDDPDARDPIDRLARPIEDLEGWNEHTLELANAHHELAVLLMEAPERAASDEIAYHWRTALRIYYTLDQSEPALACLAALGRLGGYA